MAKKEVKPKEKAAETTPTEESTQGEPPQKERKTRTPRHPEAEAFVKEHFAKKELECAYVAGQEYRQASVRWGFVFSGDEGLAKWTVGKDIYSDPVALRTCFDAGASV